MVFILFVVILLLGFVFGWLVSRVSRYFYTGKRILYSAFVDMRQGVINVPDTVVGVFSATLFLLFILFAAEGATTLFLLFSFSSILVLMFSAVYDFQHKILPDEFSYTFILLAFVSMFFGEGWQFTLPSLQHVAAGVLIPLPFFLMWLGSKGKWLGFGDIKLMIGMGWLLGLWHAIDAVILGFWSATAVVIIMVAFIFIMKKFFPTKTLGVFEEELIRAHELPFGPFLILGTFLVMLGVHVLGTILPLL